MVFGATSRGKQISRRRTVLLLPVLLVLALIGASLPGVAQAATKAPTGLSSGTVLSSTVTLSWSSVKGAPKYRVKYSTTSNYEKPKYYELTSTTTRLINLKPKTTYYVKVRVISAAGKELSPYSSTIKVKTAASDAAPLRVGSYNVRCYTCYAKLPNEGTWQQRRSAVVATILGEDLDVVGLQEASQTAVRDSKGNPLSYSQFQDLVTRLGSPWKITSNSRYNCVRDTTPSSCRYQDRGAAKGNKIIYNDDRIKLLESGSKLLPSMDEDHQRWVAWARFQQRSTGLQFMFSTAHLEAEKSQYALRKKEAQAALATIQEHNPDGVLPMIAVGDLNSNKWASPDNAPYDVYLAAGFLDPLGNAAGTTVTAPAATVEKRTNTWLNSANGFERKARGRPNDINGTYIDYILTTPMRVSDWETVANLDNNGNFVGRIPSDHNLIRATVWLPYPGVY